MTRPPWNCALRPTSRGWTRCEPVGATTPSPAPSVGREPDARTRSLLSVSDSTYGQQRRARVENGARAPGCWRGATPRGTDPLRTPSPPAAPPAPHPPPPHPQSPSQPDATSQADPPHPPTRTCSVWCVVWRVCSQPSLHVRAKHHHQQQQQQRQCWSLGTAAAECSSAPSVSAGESSVLTDDVFNGHPHGMRHAGAADPSRRMQSSCTSEHGETQRLIGMSRSTILFIVLRTLPWALLPVPVCGPPDSGSGFQQV